MNQYKYKVDLERAECEFNANIESVYLWVTANSVEEAENIMFNKIQQDPHILGAELIGLREGRNENRGNRKAQGLNR